MSVPSENPLLEAPGPMGAVLQHLDIVIGFEHKHVRGPDSLHHQFCDVPQIREKTHVRRVRSDQESHGILGVVRNGKGLHQHISDIETRTGGEQPEIHRDVELEADRVGGGPITVNRDSQFFREDGQALDVVAGFVGYQDAGKVFRSSRVSAVSI
jgi:hypothetical protein